MQLHGLSGNCILSEITYIDTWNRINHILLSLWSLRQHKFGSLNSISCDYSTQINAYLVKTVTKYYSGHFHILRCKILHVNTLQRSSSNSNTTKQKLNTSVFTLETNWYGTHWKEFYKKETTSIARNMYLIKCFAKIHE